MVSIQSSRWIFLAICVIPFISLSLSTLLPPAVKLSYGSLVGVTQSASNTVGFYGVPFAQPPTGPLRFQPPRPIENDLGQINATKPAISCLRVEFLPTPQDSEDCLYLDVVVPKDALPCASGGSTGRALPVIMFIHGFVIGFIT